jgi:hypothetical protein
MYLRRVRCAAALSLLAAFGAPGQVIQFESKGLKYQTLTRRGVTVMFAQLPSHVRDFTILQAAVSNGSPGPYVIRPEDFGLTRPDGSVVRAWSAHDVVELLIEKGGRNDVVKLVKAYEDALYGINNMRLTNAYEQRRQTALASGSAARLKAAAAASAIALIQTRLAPGESTDGAVFFQTERRAAMPPGTRLVVRTNTDSFEFDPE